MLRLTVKNLSTGKKRIATDADKRYLKKIAKMIALALFWYIVRVGCFVGIIMSVWWIVNG